MLARKIQTQISNEFLFYRNERKLFVDAQIENYWNQSVKRATFKRAEKGYE